MRTIALSLIAIFGSAAQTAAEPWLAPLTKLASSLSEGNVAAALESFDRSMKEYGTIEANLMAITAQTEIVCAIDVTEDKPAEAQPDTHLVSVDWYIHLKPIGDAGPAERRRQQVHLVLKKAAGKWKITSLEPVSILSPLQLR